MTQRLLEDPAAIKVMFHRLVAFAAKVTLAAGEHRGLFEVLACEADGLVLGLPAEMARAIPVGTKATLGLEDRGLRFETVVAYAGPADSSGIPCGKVAMPRSLRRTDSHRFATFVPDDHVTCTFSNARGGFVDATVKGLGAEGVEVGLRDSRQNVRDHFRMGEEATLDVTLEGGVRVVAPTKVAYFGDSTVGLAFTDKADKALMSEFRDWLDNQQQLQIQRDREEFELGGRPRRPQEAAGARLLVDRDPMILLVGDREELFRRMGEGLGRKFGFAHLNYIKGPLQPQLKELGEGWGRTRLIIVHHQLLVASPLELTRHLVEKEQCPLPILLAGTEEDAALKAVRALEAGAVDYLSLEPFRILTVMKKLDDLLKLF